jgi:hypothetical protein
VVDHARALVGLGRLIEARERYQQVVREGVDPKAPQSWKQALVDAERELEELAPRLAWLVIRVDGPSDPSVTVDGKPIALSMLGKKQAVDPGLRAVRVTANGYVSADQSVTLREGEERELSLSLKPPPSIDLADPEPAGPGLVASERSQIPLPVWAAFGAGGLGLVVGSVTGALALGAHSDLDAQCSGDICRPKTDEEKRRMEGDRRRYRTLGTLSGVGFGVGIAGAAAGVVLLLTNQKSEDPATAGVVPEVGLGTVGVRGRF